MRNAKIIKIIKNKYIQNIKIKINKKVRKDNIKGTNDFLEGGTEDRVRGPTTFHKGSNRGQGPWWGDGPLVVDTDSLEEGV